MKYLYSSFLKNIKDSRLIESGNTVIAAFSGGKDSVTMLLLLNELQKDIHFKLSAAYFNHHIREDSQKEEQWVKEFCDSLEVNLNVGGDDVPAFKSEHKLNLENAASIMRTRFLKEVAAARGNAGIATAHTKSDLAETFFIKLLRGSGSRGLSSIYQRVGENYIRPLLIFSQKQILQFLERNSIEFYRDYTNEQDIYLRNKIRRHLIPEIEKIEPDFENRVFKTITLVRDEYEYFREKAAKILEENLILKKILPVKILANRHLAVQRHILREYIRLLKGNLLAIDFEHVENIITNISKSKGLAVPGLEIKIHKGYIYSRNISIPDYYYIADRPGTVKIREIDQQVILEMVPASATVHSKKPLNSVDTLIPYSLIKFPLVIRSPRKEDKYIKLNSSFAQRVFEMIRESGFPAEIRNLCPVVINGDGQPVQAAGSPVSHRFRVTNPKEKQYLHISCSPNNRL